MKTTDSKFAAMALLTLVSDSPEVAFYADRLIVQELPELEPAPPGFFEKMMAILKRGYHHVPATITRIRESQPSDEAAVLHFLAAREAGRGNDLEAEVLHVRLLPLIFIQRMCVFYAHLDMFPDRVEDLLVFK